MIGKIATLATDTHTHKSTLQVRVPHVRQRLHATLCMTTSCCCCLWPPSCFGIAVVPGATTISKGLTCCAKQPRPPSACANLCAAIPSLAQVEVHRLVWFVGILAFTIAMILFVIGLIRKMDPLNAFVNGFILVVVANVPEVRMHTWGRHGPGASSVGSPLPRILALINPSSFTRTYYCPHMFEVVELWLFDAAAPQGLPATVTSLLSLTALRLRDRKVLIKRTGQCGDALNTSAFCFHF